MTKLLPDLTTLRHRREMRFYGARRSGNHAIINWIGANAMDSGMSVCFLNDLNHNSPPSDDMLLGVNLPSLQQPDQTAVLEGPDLLMISFEEENALAEAIDLETGRDDYQLIWIRRDPLEVWASRLARVEKLKTVSRKGQKWEFDMVAQAPDGRFRFLDLWDSFHPVPENAVVIDYEQWNGSPEYRKTLARQLRIGLQDKGKTEVPAWGYGSSFDKPPAAGERRYAKLKDHPLMIEFRHQLNGNPPTKRAANDVMARAESIRGKVFLGGTIGSFENHGRDQFVRLLNHGLRPESKLLDIGCGCLRGGYWTIRFLDSDCYFGIEPNGKMLAAGKESIIGQELLELKEPRFDSNDAFDFSVFEQKQFDFFMAGSIWTHSPKVHIRKMLRQFAEFRSENGIFLGTFVRTKALDEDYQGSEWVGKSHQSDQPGLVKHRLESLQGIANEFDLLITHLQPRQIGNISWFRVTGKPD